MTQYINKSDVMVEIESYINSFCDRNGYLEDAETNGSAYETLCDLKSSIDTLEVKEIGESSAADRGMVDEIIFNLKRVEQDYFISLTKEIEWLRNKVKKGE